MLELSINNMKNQGYYFKIKICQPEFNRVFLEYKDAVGDINSNKEKHIVFNTPSNLSEKQWWKKPEIIISLIILVIAFISIPWWPNILDWIKGAVFF